mgnify:FL=1
MGIQRRQLFLSTPSEEKNLILAFGRHIGPCDPYAFIMIQ